MLAEVTRSTEGRNSRSFEHRECRASSHSLGLPYLHWIERKGSVLHHGPFGPRGDVLGLNLTRGCVHRCPFCPIRANAAYPGDHVIQVYQDTPARLEAELAERRKLPRAVIVSPGTDPFPPVQEIQDLVPAVVETLAKHGVECWLTTRGFIRPCVRKSLLPHAERIKATVSILTMDRTLQRTLEPLAAPPVLRLRQIGDLREMSIAVQVALEPLVPGLTDTRANLLPLLQALAKMGVKQVRAGYMFFRSGMRQELCRALSESGQSEKVLESFAHGPLIGTETIAPARYLPRSRRQRGYASLMALASQFDIRVSLSELTNPDFQSPLLASPAERSLFPQVTSG
jgi:DNA repair photolyase